MKKHHQPIIRKSTGIIITAFTLWSLQGAFAAIGEFAANCDVGNPAKAGSASYDAPTDTYTVSGAGKNIWFDKDEFHYVWRKIKGDFILQTRAHLVGKGVELHRKLGLMVRPASTLVRPRLTPWCMAMA